MFDHRLVRQELEEGADRVILVRHAIFENPHRLLELFGIRVCDVGVSDFGPVANAAEGVFRHRDVRGIEAGRHGESQCNDHDASHASRTRYPRYVCDETAHVSAPFCLT